MADQNSRIDALLDSLSSATSEEIETALRIYEPADVAAVVAKRAGSGGGGGSPSTTSVTLTANRGSGFVDSHIFDLGQVASFYVRVSALTFDPDGETPGTGSGDIAIDVEEIRVSRDGSTWGVIAAQSWINDVIGDETDALFDTAGVTARYVQVHNFRVIDAESFEPYAGSNDPIATATAYIEYL